MESPWLPWYLMVGLIAGQGMCSSTGAGFDIRLSKFKNKTPDFLGQ